MLKFILILGVLLYFLSPYDLFPDLVFGWGWLDDIGIAWLLWQLYKRYAGTRKRPAPGPGGSDREEADAGKPKSPHEILGVPADAGPAEIQHAYRVLAAQYHPDKVAHLGEEFRELAEQKFKEIQDAYQQLKTH